jgi:hypothetical protein
MYTVQTAMQTYSVLQLVQHNIHAMTMTDLHQAGALAGNLGILRCLFPVRVEEVVLVIGMLILNERKVVRLDFALPGSRDDPARSPFLER